MTALTPPPALVSAPRSWRLWFRKALTKIGAFSGVAVGLIAISTLAGLHHQVERQESAYERLSQQVFSQNGALRTVQHDVEMVRLEHSGTLARAVQAATGSVYLVGAVGADGQGWTQIGTAWVVRTAGPKVSAGGPRDLLVTNAHVAELAREAAARAHRVVVRLPGLVAHDLTIRGIHIHPGWELAKRWTESPLPQLDSEGSLRPAHLIAFADVALLEVDRGTAGPALPLASEEEMRRLGPGEPVGVVGYPAELMAGPRDNHVAQGVAGTLTAITTVFQHAAEREEDRLLLHIGAPLSGGASGSPVLTPSGHVVGVFSAGNLGFASDLRIPIGTGYAQSVRFVREMLDGSAEAAQAGRTAAWRRELLADAATPEQMVGAVQAELAERALKTFQGVDRIRPFVDVASADVSSSAPGECNITFPTDAGVTYVVIATSGPLGPDLKGEILGQHTASGGSRSRTRLPVLIVDRAAGGETSVRFAPEPPGAAGDLGPITVRVLRLNRTR